MRRQPFSEVCMFCTVMGVNDQVGIHFRFNSFRMKFSAAENAVKKQLLEQLLRSTGCDSMCFHATTASNP